MADPGGKLKADAQGWLRRASSTLRMIIDGYAFVEVIARGSNQPGFVINDFFYYCLTKSTKSLIGINVLLAEGLGEDAQILLRSAYENYLAIAFLLANPTRLDDLVQRKVGLKVGRYQHPLNPKGKKDWRKIEDPESGERWSDVSIAEMVKKSKHAEDQAVHWPLYGFLSEHCHPHFIGSGNYRDESQISYSYEDRTQLLQASIYGVYVFLLLLAEAKDFEDLENLELRQTSRLLKSGDRIVLRALDYLIFDGSMKDMPAAMRLRIGSIKRLPASL